MSHRACVQDEVRISHCRHQLLPSAAGGNSRKAACCSNRLNRQSWAGGWAGGLHTGCKLQASVVTLSSWHTCCVKCGRPLALKSHLPLVRFCPHFGLSPLLPLVRMSFMDDPFPLQLFLVPYSHLLLSAPLLVCFMVNKPHRFFFSFWFSINF